MKRNAASASDEPAPPLTPEEIRRLLIDLKKYVLHHGILIGECVAWTKLKAAFDVDAAFVGAKNGSR